MSVELSEDSVNIDAIISREMQAALAGEVDRVALRGSGVDPEPRGILNQTGVTLQSTGAAGAALGYDPILDAAFTVLGNNIAPERLKVISNARSAKSLAKLKNVGGDYLTPPAAAEVRISPQHAKKLVTILIQQLDAYEKTVGPIPLPD